MPAFDFPADLMDLQRRFLSAGPVVSALCARLPRSTDIAAGRAEVTAEQWAELDEARQVEVQLAVQLSGHPWFETVPAGDRVAARRALRETAQPSASTTNSTS